jgi:hypothetical protein
MHGMSSFVMRRNSAPHCCPIYEMRSSVIICTTCTFIADVPMVAKFMIEIPRHLDSRPKIRLPIDRTIHSLILRTDTNVPVVCLRRLSPEETLCAMKERHVGIEEVQERVYGEGCEE